MARKINFILISGRLKCRQKGMALIFFAFLLGLVVTGFGIKLLSGGGLQIQQSVKSTQALAEAKAAVIGNVISGRSGTSTGQFPCSEDVALIGNVAEGQALGGCSNTVTSIGRFAWRTMGTGDLRDGNNDKLWYALSASFRGAPINSDTIGQLSLDGVQNQAVALLFSPGAVLSSQSRPTPTSSSPPVVSNYLETENSDADNDFITGASTATFNDKLLTIKADDVFPVLEKRVLGEFKNYLNTYKAVWGAFPFPAVFGNPTTATYVGSSALTGGFLPISNTSPTTAWDTSTTPTPVVSWPAGNSGSSPPCTFRTNTAGGIYPNGSIRCEITISRYNSANPPVFSITGVVNNIGLNFYDGFSTTSSSDVRVTTRSGTATVVPTSRAVTHSLINVSGDATVTFTGVLANTGIVRIEYRRTPQLSNWVLAATNHYLLGGSSGNNWHHLVYYKVATPFLPGGSATCGVSCLTVNTINVAPNTTLSGNHVLLMSAGRRLDITNVRPSPTYSASNPAQTRPNSLLAHYFDSSNNISGGLVFDSTNLPLTTFNDQVQIVE